MDLSSSSTVIPSQGLGSANSMKSSSSCVVTVVPIPVIGMNIDGHTSLNASVIARLVGMSSLALTENRSAHKKAQKPVSAESSSLDADTCLPLSVDASVLLIENALDLFTTHPCDDVTLIGGSNIVCVSDDPYNASVPSLLQSNNLLKERGQELCDAIPLHTEHHPSTAISNITSHHPKTPSTRTPAPALASTLIHALPLSARLGALGHACHQASLTATSILSIPEHQSTTSGSNHQQDLGILLMWVFRAHKKIGSIEVEDDLLSEASDAAELILRRHSLHGSDPHATATNDSNVNNGKSIKYNRQAVNIDHQQSGHSIGDSRVLNRQERASGEPHATAHSRESSSFSSRETSLFDEEKEKEKERETDDNRFTGSEYDRNVSSGSVSTHAHTDSGNQGASPSSSSSSSSVRRGRDVTQSFGCGSSGTSMSQSSTHNSTSNRAADTPSNREHTQRWSDDSSEESEDSDIIDITTHTKQYSASTRHKKNPLYNDPFSLSVAHFPDAWKGSVDRYDIPCNAIEDYFEEYDNAVSGTYFATHRTCFVLLGPMHFWKTCQCEHSETHTSTIF